MLAWLIFWNTLCSEKFVLVGLKPGWIPKISLLRRFPGSGWVRWVPIIYFVSPRLSLELTMLPLSYRALWNFYFSTKNYGPSGIWALDYVLTGLIFFYFVWTPHKLTKNRNAPPLCRKTNILKYRVYCIQNEWLSHTVSTKQTINWSE